MMKPFKYIISILLIGAVTSCSEEFLQLDNPNQQTTSTFWQSESDAIKGINAVYQSLTIDGLYMRLWPWVMDVRADDCYNTSPWWTNALSNWTTSPENVCYYTIWQAIFQGIWRANQVLTYVPDIEMDEELKARILAEARFLRGLYYYHGTVMYKDIPLILELPETPEDLYPVQVSQAEIFEQVYEDLSAALPVLPTKQEYPPEDMGRATSGAAAGYLAKAYMFQGAFELAAPLLKSIIDQELGSYSLVANYRDNFTVFNENNSESVFEIQFSKNVGGTTLGWVGEPAADWSKTSGKARTYAPLGYGWGDLTPTTWIFEEYQQDSTVDGQPDPRLRANFFYDYPGAVVYGRTWENCLIANKNTVPYYIRKYLNDDTDPDEVEWRSEINERILRYADILLLYAECLNETGRTGEAYQYIQMVRNRANLPDLATKKPGMTQQEMRMQISHERAVEFAFEGLRYTDLLRWGWLNQDAGAGTNPMLELIIEHDDEFATLPPGREWLAIPQGELDVNPNIQQLPGW